MSLRQAKRAERAAGSAERAIRITARASAATPGPWGHLRASGDIVAACGHDPDATFIAHARADVPWLLGQLAAEQTARAALERRLAGLVAAIGRANEALDRLPRRADGLLHLVAESQASGEVVAAVHAAASALDPEALGLKDGARDRHARARVWAGPPAASAGAGGPARPSGTGAWEGVVARLS